MITSRDAILRASRELIQTQGLPALSIRAVAESCQISVGSIYNYFSSKSDLTTAAVESVWCDIFHFPEQEDAFDSFLHCVEWIFTCIKRGEERYPGFFTLHSMSFMGEEREDGQRLMAQSWQHIQSGLLAVLKNDKNVKAEVFNDSFTRERFVQIIFSLIISALIQRDYDCSTILEIIRRVIYI